MNTGVARVYSPFQKECLAFQYGVSRIVDAGALSKLSAYLSSKKWCNFRKHYYHNGVTRADFNNGFKNHVNIGARNYLVYNADEALVVVFINSNIVNNTLIMKCFNLICSIESLSMRRINTGVHEFVKLNSLIEYLV